MEYKRITLRIPLPTYKDVLNTSEEKGISVTAEIISRLQSAHDKVSGLTESDIKKIALDAYKELNKK